MSKMIVAFHRVAPDAARARARMQRVLEEITPDLIRADARHEVWCANGQVMGGLDLPAGAVTPELCLLQGKLFDTGADWATPGTPRPDGCYAIVRADAHTAEFLTDPAGGRTLWWYFDDEMLVASNSQRAVTLYAGRFAENPQVRPWILSTGTPGPGLSYNRLLRMLPPDATLRLDRAAWTMSVEAEEPEFAPLPRSRADHLAALDAAVTHALGAFDAADAAQSIISLSGGVDSRLIAATLHRLGPDIPWRSFTDGPEGALDVPGSDAAIGTAVARELELAHVYVPHRARIETADTVLQRFVLCGEGRTDHLTAYTDGMRFLKELRDMDAAATIRGDVFMGWSPLDGNDPRTPQRLNMLMCQDIANLEPRLAEFDLADQRLPEAFERRAGDTMEIWRDRLYLQFRLTHVLGPLTELKAHFSEILNPLLSRRMLAVTKGLPDEMRTGRALYRDYVRAHNPDLPFAVRRGGDAQRMYDFLFLPETRAVLTESLRSATCRDFFGAALADWLQAEIGRRMSPAHRLWRGVRRRAGLGSRLRDDLVEIDPIRLTLRAHMAVTMIDQLRADARLFGETPAARSQSTA